jgi:hypothetical protein
MESGARTSDRKVEAGGADAAKVIADAHQGFFQDLNNIHNGFLERLHETHKKHARPAAELQTQTPENIQSVHDEYYKAMQAVYTGTDVTGQASAAFEKYKAALTRALGAVTNPAELALLSQSMYIVATYAAQLPLSKSTP